MNKDTETIIPLLEGYLRQISGRLMRMSVEQWDWRINPAAGTIHELATHSYHWLVADRMHITEPDARFHDEIPNAPLSPQELAQAIDAERIEWVNMLKMIRFEDMDAPRQQFNHPQSEDQDVRWMIMHALQTLIFDYGQMLVIFCALGMEGNQPYIASSPRDFYSEMRKGWQTAAAQQA
jgi:hypothetical protein